MKLYFHPVSTTCRPILLFAADEGLKLDTQVIDLFKGEHKQPSYLAINCCGQVPLLEDGDFRLSESSAILKYLAEKTGSRAYPAGARERARVNEAMDWFNTGLYRDLGYGLVYGQTLPDFIYSDAAVQSASLARAQSKARRWLDVLDRNLIGPDRKFICGNDITLADYLGVCFLTVGEVVRLRFDEWPNVTRWIQGMKARPNWAKVNEGFYQYFVGGYKDGKFIGL
ncbi:MAG TPA: glutathione S-transferase family protein [Burkholderiales bacterium]|jgi:glutathione S-transferase|nr:glutathione S-transferase family protein [Burkholderiales bacterium]